MAASSVSLAGETNAFLSFLQVTEDNFSSESAFEALSAKYRQASDNGADQSQAVDTAFRAALLSVADGPVHPVHELLRLAVTAAQAGIGSPSSIFALLTDLFDTASVDQCKQHFTYVEENVHIWKTDMFFSNGKHTLLRMCNDILKRLSKSQNAVFCGRIQVFLARLFPLSEKSALNLPSHFNTDNLTVFARAGQKRAELASPTTADGNKEEAMDISSEGSAESSKSIPVDYNLYRDIWSLQELLANPALLYDDTHFHRFRKFADHIMKVFGSYKLEGSQRPSARSQSAGPVIGSDSTMDMSQSSTSLTSQAQQTGQTFFPKYLTNEKLLRLQLSDSNFRRYLLIQLLITFQYLEAEVKFKSSSQKLKGDQAEWVKKATSKAHELISETPPDGKAFSDMIRMILEREEHWNSWKNASCPPFEKKPAQESVAILKVRSKRMMDNEDTDDGEGGVKRRKMTRLGTEELTTLWNINPDNLAACRSKSRAFLPSIEEYFAEAVEQADPAAGIEEEYKLVNDPQFAWRAVRLMSRKSPHFFVQASASARPLPEYLNTMIAKIAKDLPQNQNAEVDIKTEEATDEPGEDIKEDDVEMKADEEAGEHGSADQPITPGPSPPSAAVAEDGEDESLGREQLAAAVISTAPARVPVSVTHIAELSKKVAASGQAKGSSGEGSGRSQWEALAHRLQVTEDEIAYLKEEAKDDESRCSRVLTIWKETEGVKATLNVLQAALEAISLADLLSGITDKGGS